MRFEPTTPPLRTKRVAGILRPLHSNNNPDRLRRREARIRIPQGGDVKPIIVAFLLAASAALAAMAHAAVPRVINFQGYLVGSGSTPVDGSVAMVFRLYTVPSGGTAIYTETLPSVTVTNGSFSALIGSLTPIPPSVLFDQQYYLGVTVGLDDEMLPRQVLSATPYALRTDSAASADTLAPAATVQASQVVGTAPPPHIAAPQDNKLSPVDSTDKGNEVGSFVSLTVGPDGLPVMSYYAALTQDLKVARCATPDCSTIASTQVVDTDGAGQYSAITIGANGLPVVAYFHSLNGRLKVATCGNPGCTSGNTLRVVDANVNAALAPSIAIGGDGLPMISYYSSAQKLRYAKCGDAFCTAASATFATLGDGVGQATAVSLGANGLPVIAFTFQQELFLVQCGDAVCSQATRVFSPAVSNSITDFSMIIGMDGMPFFAVNRFGGLLTRKCADAGCASAVTGVVEPPGMVTPLFSSIAVGPDGMPNITYFAGTTNALKFLKCSDPGCKSGAFQTLIASGVDVTNTSVSVGRTGLPVIAYREAESAVAGGLRVLACSTPFCAAYFRRR
jgi:hypothetical protein